METSPGDVAKKSPGKSPCTPFIVLDRGITNLTKSSTPADEAEYQDNSINFGFLNFQAWAPSHCVRNYSIEINVENTRAKELQGTYKEAGSLQKNIVRRLDACAGFPEKRQ